MDAGALGPELLAMVAQHVDPLMLPVLPFVCSTFGSATRLHRLLDRESPCVAIDASCRPKRHYGEALIKARFPALVRWACACGCPMRASATSSVIAASGDLDLLVWWDDRLADTVKGYTACAPPAATRRPLGHVTRSNTAVAAAHQGHLHIVQWLRKQGCHWHESIGRAAAMGGYLDILDWVTLNGCLVDCGDCAVAARRNGHTALADWISTTLAERMIALDRITLGIKSFSYEQDCVIEWRRRHWTRQAAQPTRDTVVLF